MKQLKESLHLPSDNADLASQKSQGASSQEEVDAGHSPQQNIVTPDQLLRSVVENAPIVLFTLDHSGIITMCEGQGLQAMGLRPGEAVGTSFFEFHKNTPGILNKFIQVLDGNAVTSINQIGSVYFETHYTPLLDSKGAVSGVIGVATDITERIKFEEALKTNEHKLRTMIEQATDLILILDASGVFTYASPSHQRIMGYAPAELIGRNVFEFIHPADKKGVHIAWEGAFEGDESVATIECRLRHANGSWITVEAIGRNCLDDPDIRGFIINARDISERAMVQEQLRYQLLHDNLTDLPNRTYLLEKLDDAIQKAALAEKNLALLVLDLNRFRDINDTFGHVEGDHLLQDVVKRLQQAISDPCIIARLDGDEFAILLPANCAETIYETIARLQTILEEPFFLEEHSLQIDVKMGVSLFPTHGEDPGTLLRKADVALYTAKRTHQPFVVYEVEHDQNTAQRLELISGLRHAILANEFMLYYQPKADIKTGMIHSVEALIRWQHPAHGLIFPDRFIPLAEQTGFITSLTLWTIETAIRQYKAWQARGIDLEIAVNLSMWDLHNAILPAKIAALFEKYQVPADCVCMEVTESAAMSDPDLTISVLERLAALGIRCSLDDFGTGYSSLAYLKRLPVSELKIDRTFIQHITDTEVDQAIVKSTIAMAQSLGLHVVAEGVEDAHTMELLSSFGCDVAQGYYLTRPLPPPQFEQWLQNRQPVMVPS